MMPRYLISKKTNEMTEKELRICRNIYVSSKTVNAEYCPTPDYGMSEEEQDDYNHHNNISAQHDDCEVYNVLFNNG